MTPEDSIAASRFKAQCLAILDRVQRTRAPVLVTKHGRPVARIVPIEVTADRNTRGSIQLLVREDEAYYGTGQDWEADGSTQ